MNYQALTEQAAELVQTGQYLETEVICRKILKKKPKHFHARQLLGLAQSQNGQVDAAIVTLKQAISRNRQHASVRVNLANAYLSTGRVDAAIKSSKQAIAIDSSKFEGHLALGNALSTGKYYEEAEQCYRQALSLSGMSAEVMDGLGECLRRQGRLSEAVDWFLKANEANPMLSGSYIHLFQTLMLMHITDDAVKVGDAALASGSLSSTEAFELWVGKAKVAWLTGHKEAVCEALAQAGRIIDIDDRYTNLSNLRAYYSCIKLLMQISNEHPELYAGEPDQGLFFIAESHCLAPSEVVVNYRQQPHRILSALITGCKMWHLAEKTMNQYQASLGCFFNAIPVKSTVVLGVGEIDCRAEEGILHAFVKKGIDYHQSIPVLVDDYLCSVLKLAQVNQHDVIIYGVPAPSKEALSQLEQNVADQLCEVITILNGVLRQACRDKGLDFLDVYALTVGEKSRSNMRFHIDNHHIQPALFFELFDAL